MDIRSLFRAVAPTLCGAGIGACVGVVDVAFPGHSIMGGIMGGAGIGAVTATITANLPKGPKGFIWLIPGVATLFGTTHLLGELGPSSTGGVFAMLWCAGMSGISTRPWSPNSQKNKSQKTLG